MDFVKIGLFCTLVGCGTSTGTVFTPAYVTTAETCHQLELRAVRQADTREEAVEEVADLRRRCDLVFDGLTVGGELVEELRGEAKEE